MEQNFLQTTNLTIFYSVFVEPRGCQFSYEMILI